LREERGKGKERGSPQEKPHGGREKGKKGLKSARSENAKLKTVRECPKNQPEGKRRKTVKKERGHKGINHSRPGGPNPKEKGGARG